MNPTEINLNPDFIQYDNALKLQTIPSRDMVAAMIMQGLAGSNMWSGNFSQATTLAIECADKLLAELERTKK